MLSVSQLFIYPIKSLGGISVESALVTGKGLEYDRRWMLVDENNSFLTQREFTKMSLIKVELEDDNLRVKSTEQLGNELVIPFNSLEDGIEKVTIWNATCEAKRVGVKADNWFSSILGIKCKLVHMPDNTMRPVDTTSGFHPEGKFTSFSDAYPFMMLGEASMDDLNSRLLEPVSVLRFRPNIVFSGGFPCQEDEIEDFEINSISFTGLENCARCKIPNIDNEKGILDSSKEPLKTLATYRLQNKKIVFGRNVVHSGTGIIKLGDELKLT